MDHGSVSSPGNRLLVVTNQLVPQVDLSGLQPNTGIVREDTSNQTSSQDKLYAVPLPEHLTPDGQWHVYRSATCPEKLTSTYDAPDDHIRTLHDNLETSISRYPHVPFLGTRKRSDKGTLGAYTWITYSQAGDIRTAIGSGFMQLGLTPRSTVGIYSVNCKEWLLADAAAHAYNMVTVPLYDTLGPDVVEYICNHAELSLVACSAAVMQTVVKVLPNCPTVNFLVVWGISQQKLPEVPAGSRCRIMTLDYVESLGRRYPKPHILPRPAEIASICYTSGTTGVPKGASLPHGALIANSAGSTVVMTEWRVGDRYISYLPLAHIYERVNVVSCVHLGASIGFYSGNVLDLLDDIQALRPHVFPSVPRLWNRIYDRVMGTIRTGNPISRMLFEKAFEHKKAALDRGDPVGGRLGRFYDRLVFSKVKARLGGEVKYLITGSSPISAEVMQFLRICFGAVVLEGYGMTEACCTITVTRPEDTTLGHVGAPITSCEVKLVDIPEMAYTTKDKPHPRGEVCVRGPIMFAGYYKDEVQTREVVDDDGWLHTGDVGMWLPGGRLKIIDRKKNIFKLSQGEYIAPEKIENVYARSPMVAQSFVYGDSLRSHLVAVVVPDPDVLLPWAADRGMKQELPALCCEPAVVAAVQKSMMQEGKAAQLRGFEQVGAIHLVPEPFSVENGLLTPSFKLKRALAKVAFQKAIDNMYAELDRNPSSTMSA